MRNVFVLAGSLALAWVLHATTTTVSTGPQLQAAIQNAANGDTILLNDGTYTVTTAPSSVAFDILKSVTIRSINGASHVTLSGAGLYITVRIGASNVTLDGVTVSGANGFGVYVTDWTNSYGGVIPGATLRNLVVSTAAPPAGANSQGIAFGATNSIIELCTVSNTDGHAISMSGGTWNLIINNTISNTGGNGIGIPVLQSDHNVVAGNTLTNIGADGILLDSSQYNYVAYNTITSPHNGVTLSDDQNTAIHSIRNYIGNNLMVLADKSGSDGLWVNNDSDWNLVALNDATGASENALALYNSTGNYLRGNIFHQNPTGGIYIWFEGSGTVPVNNSVQRNYLYDHGANGGVITDLAAATDVGFNFIAGNPSQIATPIAGFLVEGTANTNFYANVVENLNEGENIDSHTTNTSLYLNRYFNVLNHYTFTGATVNWDSGSTVLGGNFFSDFTSADGNPSNGATPYTNIIDTSSGGRGVYEDHYPYQAESLGKTYGVTVLTPALNASLAAGSQKTISWRSQGCVLVDVTLLNASNNATAIATNYADFGYYRWTVPSVAPGAYNIQVNCKNSSGTAVGATSTGPKFNITTADLVLLSPQADLIADPGQSLLISWKKSANVTQPVTVNIRYSDSASYTALQAGVTNDFITVPVSGSPSNRVSVQVVSGSFADSTDGWFTIRNGNGQFTSPPASAALSLGTPYPVEWVGPPGSDYVNLDLLIGSNTRNIVTALADFGKYVILVPDFQGSSGMLRLTFYNSSGSTLGTAQTAALSVLASPCDVNHSGTTNVADVQSMINGALGKSTTPGDLNGDGVTNVVDIQIVIDAVLGEGCFAQ
jgi:parallel beta-helix repeat protein